MGWMEENFKLASGTPLRTATHTGDFWERSKAYEQYIILIYSLFYTNYRSLLFNAEGLRIALRYFINESVSVK